MKHYSSDLITQKVIMLYISFLFCDIVKWFFHSQQSVSHIVSMLCVAGGSMAALCRVPECPRLAAQGCGGLQ